MNRISACIIVKNEGDVIENCLKSIKGIVDEIIIIDGYSKDNTVDICKKYSKKIFSHRWSGSFSAERNYSISKAKFEWILVIDADESLSEKLKSKINELIQNDRINGYYIPRLKVWGNKFLRCGRAYPDYQLRLFRRTKGRFIGDIHEIVRLKGNIEKISSGYDIFHYVSFDFKEFKKQIEYAKKHAERAKINSRIREIMSILWGFFINKGFIDGIKGLRYHIFKIFYNFIVIYFIVKIKINNV